MNMFLNMNEWTVSVENGAYILQKKDIEKIQELLEPHWGYGDRNNDGVIEVQELLATLLQNDGEK